MTHRNMPRIGTIPLISVTDLSAVGNSSLPIMQGSAVRYNGQVVAAIVAETQEQADCAAALIAIDYAMDAAKTRFDDAKSGARIPGSIQIEKKRTEERSGRKE